MAFGGPIFTSKDALCTVDFEEVLYFANEQNIPAEQFFLTHLSVDTSMKKTQENKDRLKESVDKKRTNDKVKLHPNSKQNIREFSASNELSKRAKRRNRKQKIIESIQNLHLNETPDMREEKDQIINNSNNKSDKKIKYVKNISQINKKEQGTTESKKILKEMLDKNKQKVIEPQIGSTDNVTKINKKVDKMKTTLSSNKKKDNNLLLCLPPVHLKTDTKIKESKTSELNKNQYIQEIKSDKQERKDVNTIETHNAKEPVWEKDPKIDISFTMSEDEDAEGEENSGWQTVGKTKRSRLSYLSRYRYASSSVSGRSTNDEELNILTDLQEAEHSFFADTECFYESVFANNNNSAVSYEKKRLCPALNTKRKADNSQLLIKSDEQERDRIKSFVGNKENWKNIKCKKKGKIKNAEQLTLYPLSHVHSSSNNALPQEQQRNQINDLIKEGFWSLEKNPERRLKCDYKYAYNEDNMATYDVPERVLNGLKCGLCSESLSYPPITLSADNGSVCGRCPILEAENNMQPLREESYERVAGLFNFPCRYYPQGCMERLMMRNVASHEQCCTFKPYFCPVLPLGSCAWQGSATELHGHFAVSHQINLLENFVFELDIVNNYKELYLVPYLGQLFLLRTEFNCSDEIFRFSLHFVGSPISAAKYEYELVFLTANEDGQWTHPKKPVDIDENLLNRKNECTVSLGYLKETLKTPTTITCRLKINVTQEGLSDDLASITLVDLEQHESEDFDENYFLAEEDEDDDEEDDEEEEDRNMKKRISNDMVDKIMVDMECPVCQEVMIPPIYQCVVGHSVCDSCKPKLKECPTCRNTIANTRNFTLERLSENLLYKCKNRIDGCTYETNSAGIRQHEGECKFNPHQCPLHNILNCDWLGKSNKILSHVKTKHPDHFQGHSIFTVSYNALCVSDESMKIMKVHGEIFRIRFNYSNQMKQVSCTVQFTGPSSEAYKFMYEMHVMDMNNTGLHLISKKYCGALSDTIDDLKHCTMWHLDMVLPFASTDNLLKMHCVVTKV